MLRLLLLVALALALWSVLSPLLDRSGKRSGGRDAPPAPGGERLVRCAACGIRIPTSRALPATAGARDPAARYCSPVCRQAGEQLPS